MSADEFLRQFATTTAALALVLAALLSILLLRDRTRARKLVVPIAGLLLFLGLNRAVAIVDESEPMTAQALRSIGLVVFALSAVRIGVVLVLDLGYTRIRGKEMPKIVRDVLAAGLFFFALAAVLRAAFKVDIGELFTSAAILSVVVGLGLQDTLGSLFAGLAMQIEQPFEVGDWVTFGTTNAKVAEVSWRATRLVTRTGDLVVVPNSVMSKAEITNHSKPSKRHVCFLAVGLPYDVPPSTARSVLIQAALNAPGVLQDPSPGVKLKNFGDSAINYLVYFFIADFEDVMVIESAVNAAIWYALRRAEIAIPFPIRDVFMHEVQPAAKDAETVFAEAEKLLGAVDFLKGLDDDMRRALARRMHAVQFGAGETIVKQGDVGEIFYIVAEGEVNIRLRGPDNVERKMASVHRGDYFGEMSLLTGEPRAATVVARTDTLLLTIDREGFRETLQHPEVAKSMTEILAHRAGKIAAAHADVAATTSKEQGRIMGKLKELFKLS